MPGRLGLDQCSDWSDDLPVPRTLLAHSSSGRVRLLGECGRSRESSDTVEKSRDVVEGVRSTNTVRSIHGVVRLSVYS